MYDLSLLNSSKKKADDNLEKRNKEFEKVYNEALDIFKEFIISYEDTKLEMAAGKFNESLKIRQNRPEPYFFLSHIFFMYDRTDLAIEYFEAVEQLDPSFPKLEELKEMVTLHQ